jgi:hypothetical protein
VNGICHFDTTSVGSGCQKNTYNGQISSQEKGQPPLYSDTFFTVPTIPWSSNLTKQVYMTLSYHVDEIISLFCYSTRLCVLENNTNGQILLQKKDQIPSNFPACPPPSNCYLCSNPIKQVHMALSCLVDETCHFDTTSLGSGCQKTHPTDKIHHVKRAGSPVSTIYLFATYHHPMVLKSHEISPDGSYLLQSTHLWLILRTLSVDTLF